jgi:hypothetical protein
MFSSNRTLPGPMRLSGSRSILMLSDGSDLMSDFGVSGPVRSLLYSGRFGAENP